MGFDESIVIGFRALFSPKEGLILLKRVEVDVLGVIWLVMLIVLLSLVI